MEYQLDNISQVTEGDRTQRPQLLKTLCILSFVMCGLSIVVFLFGWLVTMNLKPESISTVWQKILIEQPGLVDVDPALFMSEFQKVCLYFLLASIVSLAGVMMMWRLNMIGFFIYVAAELATNFFSVDINIPNEQRSYLGLIFYLVIDIAFFILYAMNLKYMKRRVS